MSEMGIFFVSESRRHAAPGTERPSGSTLLWAWLASALAASIVLWLAGDLTFYSRFGLRSDDVRSWSPWYALAVGNQAFAVGAMVALWFGWRRRALVVVAVVAVLALLGLGARAWARHEADRAWAGARVSPAAVLPIDFSAVHSTLIPYSTDGLPGGIPAQVLLLQRNRYQSVVYDPVTRYTFWVGDQIAVPGFDARQG